ncbi:4-diphosphocytidyl-2-C-methyl-D-erythritol kinase [Pelotomaculum schinkii]|uniref:4-diphosphocytidyl-2-C-methyl-D-erythritol kinase n=1 Tax=Pelotomaculum schinkii TaxID=78350 RepID=A0A4Y7RI85_9FIRM|nr:4-(cytidine 5'-diphospho)-2-C-methyl-D-erythritol kinase [Pelotomaculum schinkii]TEB08449.1 4-diphosphocytidyl-2-C-methyl-D-erythritol kinase [Pelotomaculum schinkii]
MSIKARARAKINLTLEVLGKRPDGYHEVEMVMQSIELHDYLEFSPTPGKITLTVEGDGLPAGAQNLVYRAADLLRGHRGIRQGASIHLKKYIPVAAGLAGGSADAAATLIALNKMWGTGLSLLDLMKLGERLGSDIPFCLLGGTALARGRGERVERLPACPGLGVVLVKPPFGLSTAHVYQSYKREVSVDKPDHRGMINAIEKNDARAICSHLVNMLEPVAIQLQPAISVIKAKLLQAGALGVLMSGSGPTVFGLTPDLDTAHAVAARYNRRDEQVIVTNILNTGNKAYISCD